VALDAIRGEQTPALMRLIDEVFLECP